MCNRYWKWNGTIFIACRWWTVLHIKCRICNNQGLVFLSVFIWEATSSIFRTLPLYACEQLLMQLLSFTQVTDAHLMLLLLCRERQGSLAFWCLHGVCISLILTLLATFSDITVTFFSLAIKFTSKVWKWSTNCRSGSWCWYWIREVQMDGKLSPWILCMPSTLKAIVSSTWFYLHPYVTPLLILFTVIAASVHDTENLQK